MNETALHQMTLPFAETKAGTQMEFKFMEALPRVWPHREADQRVRLIDVSRLSAEECIKLVEEIRRG